MPAGSVFYFYLFTFYFDFRIIQHACRIYFLLFTFYFLLFTFIFYLLSCTILYIQSVLSHNPQV